MIYKCPICRSEIKLSAARKRLASAQHWDEYTAICCTNKKCLWSMPTSEYDTIRAEAIAEALREAADRACSFALAWLDGDQLSQLHAAITQEEV